MLAASDDADRGIGPMKQTLVAIFAASVLGACGGGSAPDPEAPQADATPSSEPVAPVETSVDQIELHVLDCGTIDVSDLDIFSSAGDFAGISDTFTNSCWLVRHPDGDLMWDTGLPGMLVNTDAQENGVFTVSLDQTLTDQLRARDIDPQSIEYVSVSHSHFDHIGQVDQVSGATWLVHEDEYNAMFPPEGSDGAAEGETMNQFAAFASLERETFTREKDVFGDGSVIILPMPGHTPGHTVLQVMLEETGPVMLTGDLWHRAESRGLKRVPRFNTSEEQTIASMEAFEARAAEIGAKVIIQHEPADIEPLPDILR